MAMTVPDTATLKPAIVLGLLLVLLVGERWMPRRDNGRGWWRQARNLSIGGFSTIVAAILVPVSTVGVAAAVSAAGMGLLSRVSWPSVTDVACTIVALDFAIYWQHRWSHAWPLLWRFHRVHHADVAFDTTLGLRFHPGEIILSLAYKFAVVAALGAPPVAVFVYEILLAMFALATHANIAIPRSLDAALRTILVTPDWHRIHHSVYQSETDSNYGNILSFWDRLFSTHVADPKDGHTAMRIGLEEFRSERDQSLLKQLALPFTKGTRINPLEPS